MSKPFYEVKQTFKETRFRKKDMREALGIDQEERIYAIHPPNEEFDVWRVITVGPQEKRDLED